MKKSVVGVFLFMLILSGTVFAGSDETDGFRGLQWGVEFSKVKNEMTHLWTNQDFGDMKYYTRMKDEMRIGDAIIRGISYGFWKDKLIQIDVVVAGKENFDALKKATIIKFGDGHQLDPTIESYVWTGKKTLMSLEYRTEAPMAGHLMMVSAEHIPGIFKARRDTIKGF